MHANAFAHAMHSSGQPFLSKARAGVFRYSALLGWQ